MNWYYCPNYDDNGASYKIVDKKGELVGIIETEQHAKQICKEVGLL
jgi:hypothetical protein